MFGIVCTIPSSCKCVMFSRAIRKYSVQTVQSFPPVEFFVFVVNKSLFIKAVYSIPWNLATFESTIYRVM